MEILSCKYTNPSTYTHQNEGLQYQVFIKYTNGETYKGSILNGKREGRPLLTNIYGSSMMAILPTIRKKEEDFININPLSVAKVTLENGKTITKKEKCPYLL